MTPRYPHVRTGLSSCEPRRKCTRFYTILQLVRIEVNEKPAIKASMKMVKELMDINNNLHNLSIHIGGPVARRAGPLGPWAASKGASQPRDQCEGAWSRSPPEQHLFALHSLISGRQPWLNPFHTTLADCFEHWKCTWPGALPFSEPSCHKPAIVRISNACSFAAPNRFPPVLWQLFKGQTLLLIVLGRYCINCSIKGCSLDGFLQPVPLRRPLSPVENHALMLHQKWPSKIDINCVTYVFEYALFSGKEYLFIGAICLKNMSYQICAHMRTDPHVKTRVI